MRLDRYLMVVAMAAIGCSSGGTPGTPGTGGHAATGGISGGAGGHAATGGASGTGGVSGTGGALPDASTGTDAGAPAGWTLTWSDEFDGADGSAVDPNKWVHDVGGSGWGDQELEYY